MTTPKPRKARPVSLSRILTEDGEYRKSAVGKYFTCDHCGDTYNVRYAAKVNEGDACWNCSDDEEPPVHISCVAIPWCGATLEGTLDERERRLAVWMNDRYVRRTGRKNGRATYENVGKGQLCKECLAAKSRADRARRHKPTAEERRLSKAMGF